MLNHERMRKLALFSLAALHLACSGEDDPKGTGQGTPSAGTAGAAGTGSLAIGGKAGRSGAAGDAGAAGTAGKAGAAGVGGAGGLAGAAGAAGGVDLQPSKSVCGNGKLEPGERCDGTEGTTTDISCANLLGDPLATGIPSCDRCFPSYLGCVSCLDGRKNGPETDIDCGGTCAPCGLARACKVDTDCAATLGCYGGVCNDVRVVSFNDGASEVPNGKGRAFVIQVQSSLPLAATTSATIEGNGLTLESTTPLDVRRLIARLTPTGDNDSTLTIDGHAFPITLSRPNGRSPWSLSVTGVSGKMGLCGDNGAPLVLETTATGPTPGLELPAGGTICLRVDLDSDASYPTNGSLGSTTLISKPALPQKFLEFEVPIVERDARFDTGNTTVDMTLRSTEGAALSVLVPQRFVYSPRTFQKGATGVGTTSSPAGVALDTKALGGPYKTRTVMQLSGPHVIDVGGLVVPDNVVLVGVDADASLVGAPGGSAATVTLGNNSELRGLTVVGPGSGSFSGDCVSVSGKGAVLRDVKIRGCRTGVREKANASATMIGKGVDDITQVTDAIIGETGASFTGIDLGLVGDGTQNAFGAVSGFDAGKLSLVRPHIGGFARGLVVAKAASADAFDPTIEVTLGPVEIREDATASLVGGKLATTAPISIGASVGAGAKLTARGITITGAEAAGVSVSGGSVTLVGSVLRECGGPDSAAAAVSAGGSLRANGLRIEKPAHLGVFALKDAKEVSLTGTVIEATTFRSIWIFGGKATLRTVQLLDPGPTGLAYGDPAEPLDVSDLDIVRHLPCSEGSQLVFADRASATPGDEIAFRNLVAGAGKVVRSDPAKPVCGQDFFDPNGGWYLRTNGTGQTACF